MLHLQERLQGLWDVYQRLGLEDDIVDPSNTLLREGPVLKISFRRSDPMERYLFLVGAAGWLGSWWLKGQICSQVRPSRESRNQSLSSGWL